MSRNAAATKIQALWRGYRARKALASRTPLRYRRARLKGRAGRVRTRYPSKGATTSNMKIQTEPYYDNLIQVANTSALSARNNTNCTVQFLSPLSDGNPDRTLINGGTLLGANIELAFRNTISVAHQIRVSVVELVTEDKPIVSAVSLDWSATSHFADFFKDQGAGTQDEATVPFLGATAPTMAAAQYAAINTEKFRVLKTKWITLGTDLGNSKTFKGCHMYVPLRRHIDKDTIVNSVSPRFNPADNNRYSYDKPVFLLVESFLPQGYNNASQATWAYINGRIKYAMKDK